MNARNIIITGASSGLGAALAVEYAGQGIVLGLAGRDATRLEAVAECCRAKNAQVLAKVLDITDSVQVALWLDNFDARYPIDLCIANAGISAGTGSKGESINQVKRIFEVNIGGVINTLHPVMDRMVARRTGQLAIVSSIAGFRGSPTAPAYSASKAAVRYYGQALRGSLAGSGVQVTVICPGFIRTPMTEINPFPMPFIMDADKAARIIKRGLEGDKAMISFPWPMALLARLQNLLPDTLINMLYQNLPAKPSK